MTELNQLLQRLCDAEIDFVIVGGFAAMLHGSSMLTRDLDVCAVLTDASIAKLRTTFRDLHPTHRFTPQRLSFLQQRLARGARAASNSGAACQQLIEDQITPARFTA